VGNFSSVAIFSPAHLTASVSLPFSERLIDLSEALSVLMMLCPSFLPSKAITAAAIRSVLAEGVGQEHRFSGEGGRERSPEGALRIFPVQLRGFDEAVQDGSHFGAPL
jgi:hypothetical protein